MAYYEIITENQTYVLVLLYRIISSISFIPYISLLIVFFVGKIKEDFTFAVNVQICIASIMHSASYLFPSMENAATKTTVLCYIQALLNSLSDLCTLLVATAVMIVSYLNLTSPEFVINNKNKLSLVIGLVCWLLPLIFCIIIFIYGDVKSSGGSFCWIDNQTISYIYYSVCLVGYIIFFSVLYKIISEIKRFLKESNSRELGNKYIKTLRNLTFVVCLTFCVFSLNFAVTSTWAAGGDVPGQIYFWLSLCTQIGEMISCPLYVLIYCFTKQRYIELARIFMCKPLPRDSKPLEFDNIKIEDDEEGEANSSMGQINL